MFPERAKIARFLSSGLATKRRPPEPPPGSEPTIVYPSNWPVRREGLSGPGVWATAATFLSILFTLNLLLLVFNLIPVPPLDGSGAIALLLSDDSARRLQQLVQTPQLSFFGILIAWWTIPHVFWPVHGLALRLLYPEYLG